MRVSQIVKIPNEEAQFIETARFSKEQIYGEIYHVPLHRGGDLSNAHFNNIEHSDLEYAKYGLKPWLTADEQAIEKQFLTPEEQERFFVRHNLDELLRGDFKTRMEGHSVAIQVGLETLDEARALENRPAVEGGDRPLVPLNLGYLEDLGAEPEPDPPADDDEDSDEDEDE
jgi:HK97 family phage portal protein